MVDEPTVVVMVLLLVVRVSSRAEVVTGVPVTVVEPVVVVMVLPSVVTTPTRGRTVAPVPALVALALLEAMEPLALERTLAPAKVVEAEEEVAEEEVEDEEEFPEATAVND